MWYSRFRTFGAIMVLFLLTCASLAEASTNAFVEFERWPINGTGFVGLVSNEAYFRDAWVGGVTSIAGATDGESWAASAVRPDGTTIQWSSVAFAKQLGDQSNCFTGFLTGPICNTTSLSIIWFVKAQCQPTGTWKWNFTNTTAGVFATPQFTLLPEVPDVPLLNQGDFAGKKYDTICYVEQKGADGKIHKVTVPCSTPGATKWDIKAKGCVLVDAVMVLQYHGVTVGADNKPVTVENLDAWLSDHGGYNKEGGLYLDKLFEYSKEKVQLDRIIYRADDSTLRNSLCEFGPVITPVNSPSTGKAGDHSVVAIGRDDPVNPTTWKVNDPDGGVVTTLLDKPVYKNKYYGLRIFQGPEKTITFGGITIQLFSPAEFLVTDFQGRRTGFDPITNTSYEEIPLASYGNEGLEDLTSDSPGAEWKAFYVSQPADGSYETTVTGTASGMYDLVFHTTDRQGHEQGNVEFNSIPTAPGVVHKYTFDYSGTPGTPLQLSGGFDGHGQRPSDVNKFLTYANPSEARTQLPAGQTTFTLLIFYDKAIRPQSFKATINGADITTLFTPTPGSHERVNLSLASGSSNTLVLSVDGTTASGRVATDTDRLVIMVK